MEETTNSPEQEPTPQTQEVPTIDFEAVWQQVSDAMKQPVADWDLEQVEQRLGQLQDYIAHEEEQVQEAEEETIAEKKASISHHKGQLKALQQQYDDKWTAYEAAKAAEEQDNLDKKWAIVQEIKALIETAERIGPAFQKIKELQDQWRSIGNVPAHAFQQLRTAYNYEVDRFFYTISIYKDLRDLDLQRNLSAKQELVEKMKALAQEPSIRRMEMMVKALQEEWEEVGPVPHKDWNEVRDAFYKATDAVYARIQTHYDGVREQLQENLEKKQQLVNQAKQLSGLQLKSPKKWAEKSDQIIALQQQWKTIGRVPREHNESIWQAFRQACDTFFERKRAYFKDLKAKQAEGKAQKEALLNKAKAWEGSEDWKAGSQALIQLQKDWKEAAAADRATEQHLWETFRKLCDDFFERRKAHFAEQEVVQKENEEKKRALIETVKGFAPSSDRKQDFDQLKTWAREWQSIGHVPRKNMKEINEGFKKALDAQYAKLKTEKAEKGATQYKAKIELMAEMPDSRRALSKERNFLRGKIRKLEEELRQYEDNLSRFRITTKDSPLVKDMQGRLKKIESQIERLEKQLELVEEAMQ